MSPREALQTDPMQRMALTTAYEALEMSGYVPNRTPSTRLNRIGTFYSQTSDGWRELNAAQEDETYFITADVGALRPSRINYHFGFSGSSLNIDTACSSSTAAIQVACAALWVQDCDTAIVGGLPCTSGRSPPVDTYRNLRTLRDPCQNFCDRQKKAIYTRATEFRASPWQRMILVSAPGMLEVSDDSSLTLLGLLSGRQNNGGQVSENLWLHTGSPGSLLDRVPPTEAFMWRQNREPFHHLFGLARGSLEDQLAMHDDYDGDTLFGSPGIPLMMNDVTINNDATTTQEGKSLGSPWPVGSSLQRPVTGLRGHSGFARLFRVLSSTLLR